MRIELVINLSSSAASSAVSDIVMAVVALMVSDAGQTSDVSSVSGA